MAKILVVDDDIQILKSIERALRLKQHHITLESNPVLALEKLEDEPWDVIISDYMMPVVNGLSLLNKAKYKAPRAMRILMTGYSDIDVVIRAVNDGNIFKYIAKPWTNEHLVEIVNESIAYKSRLDEDYDLIDIVIHENTEWSRIADSLEHKILELSEQGIQALLKMVRSKDEGLFVHSLRVTWVAQIVGKRLALKKGDLQTLRLASLFHDIGKVAIRDSIMYKEGKLDPDERKIMTHHAVISAEILKELDFMHEVASVVLQHHERYDGEGYPYGLKGDMINILAQILSVSDVFVALVEERIYKKGLSNQESIAFIESESGTAFSREVTEAACLALVDIVIPTDIKQLEAYG